MTLSSRIKIAFLALAGAALVTVGPAWVGYQLARGDTEAPLVVHDHDPVLLAQADTGSATVTVDTESVTATPAAADTGSASVSTEAPADKLHDPVSSPSGAWDDLKAAKKTGWAVLVFAVLIMACKLLGRAKSVPWLAALGKGKVAAIVAGVGAVAAACYNALADGGAWLAVVAAGVVAMAHILDATPKAKEPAAS